jgi:Tfp pilus assembly protein PilN
MSSVNLLDADMATLGRWARSGFDWWVEELAGLVPSHQRRWISPRATTIAHFDGTSLILSRHGMPIAAPRPGLPVTLTIPSGRALVRTVSLPRLGKADLARLVTLEAERLLPFAPGTALIDFESEPRRDEARQSVTLAAIPVAAADRGLAAAQDAGLDVRRLAIANAAGGPRFDMLPAWRRHHAIEANSARRIWWGLVAFAVVLNLAAFVARDVSNLRELEAQVAAHGETATLARQLRARVLGEDRRRRDLVARRHSHDPLPVLAAVTAATPDGAWVHRLAWDGQQLRIAGFKPAAADITGALRRSPLFAGARSGGTEVGAATATGQPFDITADRR